MPNDSPITKPTGPEPDKGPTTVPTPAVVEDVFARARGLREQERLRAARRPEWRGEAARQAEREKIYALLKHKGIAVAPLEPAAQQEIERRLRLERESELRISLAVGQALYGGEKSPLRGLGPIRAWPAGVRLTPEEKDLAAGRITNILRNRLLAGGTIRHGRFYPGPLQAAWVEKSIRQAGAEERYRGQKSAVVATLAAATGAGLAAWLSYLGVGTVGLITVGGVEITASVPTWAFFAGTHLAEEALEQLDNPPQAPKTPEEEQVARIKYMEDRAWDVILSSPQLGGLGFAVFVVRTAAGPETWPMWEEYATRTGAQYLAEQKTAARAERMVQISEEEARIQAALAVIEGRAPWRHPLPEAEEGYEK